MNAMARASCVLILRTLMRSRLDLASPRTVTSPPVPRPGGSRDLSGTWPASILV